MLGSLTSNFLAANFLDLTCEKRIERLHIFFAILTPSCSNIIIFQSLSDIVEFFFPIYSLTCLVKICMVAIQKMLIQLIKMLFFCSI